MLTTEVGVTEAFLYLDKHLFQGLLQFWIQSHLGPYPNWAILLGLFKSHPNNQQLCWLETSLEQNINLLLAWYTTHAYYQPARGARTYENEIMKEDAYFTAQLEVVFTSLANWLVEFSKKVVVVDIILSKHISQGKYCLISVTAFVQSSFHFFITYFLP